MRTTVSKQSADSAGKTRKLFRCGVDEFNPEYPLKKKPNMPMRWFSDWWRMAQVGGEKKLRTTERYFKPDTIWNP